MNGLPGTMARASAPAIGGCPRTAVSSGGEPPRKRFGCMTRSKPSSSGSRSYGRPKSPTSVGHLATPSKNENAARNWAAFGLEVQRSLSRKLHQIPEFSSLVVRVETVELAQQRRPYQLRRAQLRAIGIGKHLLVLVDHRLFDGIGGRPQHAGADLHGAGPLPMGHAPESGSGPAARRQRGGDAE